MRRSPLARSASLAPLAGTLLVLGLAPSSCSDAAGARAPSAPLEAGSPWPKFRAGAAQDGASPIGVRAHATGGALWSFRTGKGIFSSPVVGADGTVFIGSADRTFYALDPASGASSVARG